MLRRLSNLSNYLTSNYREILKKYHLLNLPANFWNCETQAAGSERWTANTWQWWRCDLGNTSPSHLVIDGYLTQQTVVTPDRTKERLQNNSLITFFFLPQSAVQEREVAHNSQERYVCRKSFIKYMSRWCIRLLLYIRIKSKYPWTLPFYFALTVFLFGINDQAVHRLRTE